MEDPHQVEEAVMHLVTNLPSPLCILPRSPSPAPITPPPQSLSIIPPNTFTIKNAIAKSISVINQAMKLKSVTKTTQSFEYTSSFVNENNSVATTSIITEVQSDTNNLSIQEESKTHLNPSICPEVLSRPINSNITKNIPESDIEPKSTPDLPPSVSNTSNSTLYNHIFDENKEHKSISTPNALEVSLFQQPLVLDCDPNILKEFSDSIINDNNPELLDSVDSLMNCDDFLSLDNLVNNLDENILNQCDVAVDTNFFNDDNLLTGNTTLIETPGENSKESVKNNVDYNGMSNSYIPPLGPLKRPRSNPDLPNNCFKKKTSESNVSIDLKSVIFSDNIDVLENILPVNNPVPDNQVFPLNDIENSQQRFETYIDELTNPNSGININQSQYIHKYILEAYNHFIN